MTSTDSSILIPMFQTAAATINASLGESLDSWSDWNPFEFSSRYAKVRDFLVAFVLAPFVFFDSLMIRFLVPIMEVMKTYMGQAPYQEMKGYVHSWKTDSVLANLTKKADETIETKALPFGEYCLLLLKSSVLSFAKICLDIGYSMDVLCLCLAAPLIETLKNLPVIGAMISLLEDLCLYIALNYVYPNDSSIPIIPNSDGTPSAHTPRSGKREREEERGGAGTGTGEREREGGFGLWAVSTGSDSDDSSGESIRGAGSEFRSVLNFRGVIE